MEPLSLRVPAAGLEILVTHEAVVNLTKRQVQQISNDFDIKQNVEIFEEAETTGQMVQIVSNGCPQRLLRL